MKYYIFILILIIQGCAHKPFKNFQKVKIGMDKGDVIHLLGGPHRAIRFDGKDIWFYQFYQKGSWIKKEIAFNNGFVHYFGPRKTKRKRSSGGLSGGQNVRVWPRENSRKRLQQKIKNNNVEVLGEEFISIEEFNSFSDK